MSDKPRPTEIPSTERGPRKPEDHEWTGIGTPRSADDGLPEPGAVGDRDAPADPAVITGAKATSRPAEADEVDVNRSGSGGSGGPVSHDSGMAGSRPADMEDLLAGDPEGDRD